MCILVAVKSQEDIIIGFNRDEDPDRQHSNYRENNTSIYPVDERSEGTWTGARKDGHYFALLNNDGLSPKNPISRGTIIPALLNKNLEWGDIDIDFCKEYPPFQLFAVVGREFYLKVWDGRKLEVRKIEDSEFLAVSSSYGVSDQRMEILAEKVGKYTLETVQDIETLLSDSGDGSNLTSPCMVGAHSRTIASSVACITNSNLTFWSRSGRPDEGDLVKKAEFEIDSKLEVSRKLSIDILKVLLVFLKEFIPLEDIYKTPPNKTFGAIGGQVRHTLEFYNILLDGLKNNEAIIDYDNRSRKKEVELLPQKAIDEINTIIERFTHFDFSENWEAKKKVFSGAFVNTSFLVELDQVFNHTIHHEAIMQLISQCHGININPPSDFGLAPSTVKYLQI